VIFRNIFYWETSSGRFTPSSQFRRGGFDTDGIPKNVAVLGKCDRANTVLCREVKVFF